MRYRADISFDSDRDEEDLALWLEDVLYAASDKRAAVIDFSIKPDWGYCD